MISADGSVKGYIARQKQGGYQAIGITYYSADDLTIIADQIESFMKLANGSGGRQGS